VSAAGASLTPVIPVVRHTKMLQETTNVLFAKRYLETAVSENYVEWALVGIGVKSTFDHYLRK
jgi:hypothetical protein